MEPWLAFFSELVSYIIKFVFLIAVAVGGVFIGKKYRIKKDSQAEAQTPLKETK